MKIFAAAQIRAWDEYTIQHEPIASIDLMETAASALAEWIAKHIATHKQLVICCGPGNNGGDGLALARLLHNQFAHITVFIMASDKKSDDCKTNLQRLQKTAIPVIEIKETNDFPLLTPSTVVIDALFGTGLHQPLAGLPQQLVEHLNNTGATIISVDMPSGLFADTNSVGNTIIKATYTLSFQCPKLAFLLADNEPYTGKVQLLNIGLHPDYYHHTNSHYYTVEKSLAASLYRPRNRVGHKYTYGHALLYAGSPNMMGAAILSAKACLRSGAGLVTVHTEAPLKPIVQTALPEALVSSETLFDTVTQKKAAIGIGPGLAIDEYNSHLLQRLLTDWENPLVIDATALTLLAPHLSLLSQKKGIPAILTPHGGEFERLFGKSNNSFDQLHTALIKAKEHNCYIILKGHHTLIACPDGEAYFNTTGNSGMATAGSGDVLTGMLTGLLAQGYEAKEACILGVYLHGLAGDLAAAAFSEEAMIAGDITEQLGAAFRAVAG